MTSMTQQPPSNAGQLSDMIRRPFLALAALAGVTALAACEPGAGVTARGPQIGPMIDPAQPVQVALLAPSGSGDAEMERISRSIINSAKMAASDAKGAKIDLRIYPTSGDPAQAAAQGKKALAEGAKIIVGPLYAQSANAVGNVAKDQVNVLSFSNNTEVAGGNVFTLGTSFGNVADRLVGYSAKQGKRRVFVVAEDDASGQLGAAAIEGAIARNRATLVGKAVHPVSESGIDGIIPQVAAMAKAKQADAIFMTANHPQVLPYLTGGLNKAGVSSADTQFIGLTRWDQPVARIQLPGVQGGWFALPDQAGLAAWQSRYRQAYGETPHDLGALGYDAVAAIAAQVAKGKRNAVTTAGLTSGAGFAGVTGAFRLRPDGTTQRALSVATIRDKKVEILDPAPRSFGGFGL